MAYLSSNRTFYPLRNQFSRNVKKRLCAYYIFRLLRVLFLLILFWFNINHVHSQKSTSGQDTVISMQNYLEDAGKEWNLRFYYRDEWLDSIQVEKLRPAENQDQVFRLIRQVGFEPIAYSDWQYILIWKEDSPVYLEYDEEGNFNREISLSGKVKLLNSEEELIGARVQIDVLDTGTITDIEGYYSLRIPVGQYQIRANSVGQEEEMLWVNLSKDTTINFELADRVITLSEIIISDEALDQNISEVATGKTRLDIRTIRSLPAFMGEVDVVRSLLMMPGVSSVGEGATGFNVRGGAVDQNLVMIDQTPVFNTSHLFGLFSVFNQDIIKDVTLYKGGIPAKFGGRLSSVLDIQTRENLAEKFSGRGGIGLISSRLTFDIPLVPKKVSLTLGGRISYNDYLLKLIPDQDISNSSAYFYDANIKFNYQLNNKNTFHLSYYRSYDNFKFPSDTAYYWGTDNVSLQWNHLFGEKLVGNFTGAYSDFRYGIHSNFESYGYQWDAGISYRNLKADFTWLLWDRHEIGFGGSFINYKFNSGNLIPDANSSLNPIKLQDDHAYESAIYIDDEWNLSAQLSIMAGIRYSFYQAVGPADVNLYEQGQPRKTSTLLDIKSFSDGEVIKSYDGFEPRFAIKIGISRNSSIKLSYNRMFQYIHLISNTMAVSPVDVWQPSNLYIHPQYSDQFSVGYFRNFIENTIETSIEAFYKDISNIVDYKDGAQLLLNENIEEELLQGRGRAYGIELLVRKKMGRLTGWLGYTYSRSEKKIKSGYDEETINYGKYYPANFDRPHDISISTNYRFTRRWSMSANFVYMTGRPTTYPEAKYKIDGFTVASFGERNQARIPDYHRLDISFTLDGNLKKNKKWDGSWTFSIYNVYSRKNAYSVYFKPDKGFIPQSYKLTVLGAPFPAITYNFKF